MEITYTVDAEALTFTEWHDGEDVGSGNGRDVELLRETGDLDPALAAVWEAMVFGLSFGEAARRAPTRHDGAGANRAPFSCVADS